MRKGLILTGFLYLLVLCLSAPTVCLANEAVGAETEEKLLGDESDGSRAPSIHLIPLFAENEDGEKGGKITSADDPLLPFSTRWTCGECHSYGIISKGWHFNAADPNFTPGRPGQPWILADGRSGTQIPLSYRPWPGTFKPEQVGFTAREFTRYFGRHTPGGGAGELETDDPDEIMREYISGKLEINCLSCHNAEFAHNQGEYFPHLVRENFRWAAAATCGFASVNGSARDMPDTYDPFMPEPPEDAKKVPPGIKYRENIFDPENNVSFNIVREVPNYRCYFCHSNLYIDKEDTEKWTSDEDIHLKAGLKCVDCHRNGISHNITRGYEGETSVSTNPLVTTSSCESCHLGVKDSLSPLAGRLGAPVPEHWGIPPVHFDKLTCTACHSGPWPSEKTILTKTSRAHRLGTLNANKSKEALPHIVAPVFAPESNGKIAPHKLLWPAYWATVEDQKVAPIAFTTVTEVIVPVFSDVNRPTSGDWPELTTEYIVKGLKALAKSVKGTPAYISAGKLYKLDDLGTLSEEEHVSAKPYLWPIAHDVRPAAQSLGVRRCEDCHSTDAPFFFGKAAVDSPIVAERGVKPMVKFVKVRPFYTKAFAFSFVFRPWMKIIALGSSAILAGVLLLYALKMLACIAKVLTERD